jgi:hypothetical protein
VTAVRLQHIEDLTDQPGLEAIVGPIAAIDRRPFSSGGFSGSSFEKITVTLSSGTTQQFVLKQTRLADDWFSQRTSDPVGREAALLDEPSLSRVWDSFACPYRAYAIDDGAIGLLMDDLAGHLFPDERKPIPVLHEDLVVGSLAEMHATFWEPDELTMPWLLMPVHYFGMMGPGGHVEDARAAPPEGIRQAMQDGWETALNELPSLVAAQIVLPPEVLADQWTHLPRTLLHGDMKIANLAVFPDQRVAAVDWAFVGHAPGTFEVGWYLAVNASRLARLKDHFVAWYRYRLEEALGGKIDDRLWKEMILAGLVCAAMMLLWTKGNAIRADREGAREEWQWWTRHLEYWATTRS